MTKIPSITAEYKKWINDNLKPNVYAVGTLVQRRRCHNGSYSVLISGNYDEYAKMYDGFIRRLTMAIYGKTNWKRHKILIPNCATLEGGTIGRYASVRSSRRMIDPHSCKAGVRYHINMSFRRPDWILLDEFRAKVKQAWVADDWAMPDVFVEKRRADCIGYSLKEGPEALLPNSMSWPKPSVDPLHR